MSEHALDPVRARPRTRGLGRLAARRLAPVPARAPDVLAQPERRVLQLPAAAALPRAVRRDLRRARGRPARDRARHRGDGGDVDDVHRARHEPHLPARVGRAQAHARHAAADVGLPRRDRRQRGHEHRACRSRSSRSPARSSSGSTGRRTGSALVVFVALGVVCFASLGVALSHAIPNFDSAPAYVNAVFLPVIFISGVFYDADDAPGVPARHRRGAAAQAPHRRAVGRDGHRRGAVGPPEALAGARALGRRRHRARGARLLVGIATAPDAGCPSPSSSSATTGPAPRCCD